MKLASTKRLKVSTCHLAVDSFAAWGHDDRVQLSSPEPRGAPHHSRRIDVHGAARAAADYNVSSGTIPPTDEYGCALLAMNRGVG